MRNTLHPVLPSLLTIFFTFITLPAFAQDTIKLKLSGVYDNQMAETAAYVLVPEGWSFDGRLQYGPQPTYDYVFQLGTLSPDGLSGYVLISGTSRFIWYTGITEQMMVAARGNVQSGCTIHEPLSPKDYFYAFIHGAVQQRYPDFQVQVMERSPELVQLAQDTLAKKREILALARSMGVSYNYDSLLLKSTYTEDGVPKEELTLMLFEYEVTDRRSYTDPNCTVVKWGLVSMESFSAERGRLADYMPLLRIVSSSFMVAHNWQAKYASFRNKSISTYTATQREIQEIYNSVYENRQETMERVFEQWSGYVRGTKTVVDPETGMSFEVPNDKDNVFINRATGEVMATNESDVQLPSGWERYEEKK